MVMDLVTGGELFNAVAEQGRLSEATTRLYFQQLVDGIHYCHTRRVFHRDLKPENLLLSGDKQTLKITDFGLSSIKAQNASSELLHTIMGSPHYIAPEIITSASEGYEGSKVDVWAAGIILFGMLAGFLPFDEVDTKALYRSIVHSPIQYPPHFSYDVIKLLRSMLQKDPNRRPSMEQVKAFAWFKVDYEPAVVPEAGPPSSAGDKTRKSRSKMKRRHEQGKKNKEDKETRRSSLPSSQKSGDRPRSMKSMEGTPRHSRVASRRSSSRSSGPMSEKSREGSVSSEQLVEKEQTNPHEGVPSEQEILPIQKTRRNESESSTQDPLTLTEEEPVTAPDELRVRFSVRTDSQYGISSKDLSSFSERQTSSKNTSEGNSLAIVQSTRNVSSEGGPCSWFSMTGTSGHQSEDISPKAERDSFAQADGAKGDGSCVEPEQSDETGPFDVDDIPTSDDPPSSGDALVDESPHDLPSPLSPADNTFSPFNSESISSFREGKRHGSLRITGNDIPTAESKMSEFISPVSLQSQSSFSSPQARDANTSGMQNYRELVPTLFQSAKSFAPLTLTSPNSTTTGMDQNIIEADQAFADVEPEDKRDASASLFALEESSFQSEEEEEEEEDAIFKPMKSLFAALARQKSETKPSIAPSVYCPEVDNDAENGPQWCVDSVEVFADVEVEDCNTQLTGKTTPSQKLLEMLRQTRAPLVETTGLSENAASFSPATPSPIFAPLDDKLALKLSPSAEDSKSAPRAVRNLPVLSPE